MHTEEVIKSLREELMLTEEVVSDEELLTRTKHSFIFARINLGLSVAQLIEAVKTSVKGETVENYPHMLGDSVNGRWYCPRCQHSIHPDELKGAEDTFTWSNESNTVSGKKLLGPHCKNCSNPLVYIEGEAWHKN